MITPTTPNEKRSMMIDKLRKAATAIQEAVDTLTAEMLTDGVGDLPFSEWAEFKTPEAVAQGS